MDCQAGTSRATLGLMALVVTFCNTKGGTTKSSLSSLTALAICQRGLQVALLDTDHEQRTSSRWIQRAEPTIPVVVEGDPRAIKSKLIELKRSVRVVIVDTPGSASPASFAATLLADIAIIPLQPSETDVDALDKALAAVSVAHESNGGSRPETFFVLTCTAVRDVQARNLRKALEASFPYAVARSEIRRFVVMRGAMGKSLSQLRGRDARKAESDVDALVREVLGGKVSGIPRLVEVVDCRKAANE